MMFRNLTYAITRLTDELARGRAERERLSRLADKLQKSNQRLASVVSHYQPKKISA